MKKWLITTIALVAILLCATQVAARPLSLNEISQAVCRVKMGTGMSKSVGTGTCIGETPDGTAYYILTNAHVVGQFKQGTVEFFKGGYISAPITAHVTWKVYRRGSDVDFAILTVTKSQFGSHPPRVIPLVPQGYKLTTGHYIASVGCPSARWAQGWEGHITTDRQSRVIFVPAPVGGQSGSGVTVLVRGQNGELYTRVGAVLTWRIGENSSARGGAIPISTLYNVMSGQHTAQEIPVNYIEVSLTCSHKTALGSNGKLYTVYFDSVDGSKTVSFGRDTNVRIITWDYYNSGYNASGRRPSSNGCPSCGSSGSLPFSDSWRKPSPQPQPQPRPGVPPYTQPNNPYGVNPPSIGAPWPGTEAPTPSPVIDPDPPKNKEGIILPPLSKELDELGQKYNSLAAEKKIIQDKLDELEGEILDQATIDQDKAQAEHEAMLKAKAEQEETAVMVASQGWLAKLKVRLNGFFGGILLGAGIGILVFIWNKFLKKRVIKHIDSIQDFIEARVSKKYGKEFGAEIRDIMEGVEDALLGFADDFVEDLKARQQVAKAAAMGKPAERVVNGSGISKSVNVKEILEAVKQASSEVGDESVTTEVPKKVEEILNRVAKAKRKDG